MKPSPQSAFKRKVKENAEWVARAAPGFKIQVFEKGRRRINYAFGKTYPYYDLASLTKIIFTASLFGRAIDEGILKPGELVTKYWPECEGVNVPIERLFTHTAGLPWWLPIYKKLKGPRIPEYRWAEHGRIVRKVKRGNSKKAVYSDVDLFVLGHLLTRATGKSLSQAWSYLSEPGLTGTMHFNAPERKFPKGKYAPTEKCAWRKRVLQGEVHDENAWALGGIAPHAGLFGTINDVSRWGLELRACFKGKPNNLMEPKTLKRFVKRRTKPSVGDWGWLFMKPSKGRASCGRYFSAAAFGHTGFTGTSLWYDPRKDILIVILSNRVHPTRKNREFVALRPKLHDWAVESLK